MNHSQECLNRKESRVKVSVLLLLSQLTPDIVRHKTLQGFVGNPKNKGGGSLTLDSVTPTIHTSFSLLQPTLSSIKSERGGKPKCLKIK